MKNLTLGILLCLIIGLLPGAASAETVKQLIIAPVTLTIKSVNQSDQSVRVIQMIVGQDGKIAIVQGEETRRPGQFLANGDYIQDEEVVATLTSSGKIMSYGEAAPVTISRDAVLSREGVPFVQVTAGEVRDVSPDKNAMVSKVTVNGKVTEIHHTMVLKADPQASRLVAYMLAISMMMGR